MNNLLPEILSDFLCLPKYDQQESILAILEILSGIIAITIGVFLGALWGSLNIIGLVISIVILYYLFRPHVKAYFVKSAQVL